MAITLTTSGAVISHAGKNVSSDLISGTTSGGLSSEDAVNEFINEAEGYISAATRVDWVTGYASYDSVIKKVLDEAVACRAANHCVKYDLGAYTNRAEAQTIMDLNRDVVQQDVTVLKDDKEKSFVEDSS